MSLFRALARRCHIPPREALRLTLSQALALLDDQLGADDPHRGNVPIHSIDDLRDYCEKT